MPEFVRVHAGGVHAVLPERSEGMQRGLRVGCVLHRWKRPLWRDDAVRARKLLQRDRGMRSATAGRLRRALRNDLLLANAGLRARLLRERE